MESKQGDAGRLAYISESLRTGKNIFRSDQVYLHKKISASVIPKKKRQFTETDEKLKNVQSLISWDFGDPGRLNYMLRCLQKNKNLCSSDEGYLELKTRQIIQFLEEEKLKQRMLPSASSSANYEAFGDEFNIATSKALGKTPSGKQSSMDKPAATTKKMDQNSSSTSKETVGLFDPLRIDHHVNLRIEQERLEISEIKNQHELTKTVTDELLPFKNSSKNHEIKIDPEKELLEKGTNLGQEKFNKKNQLVEELEKNQSKIIQTISEREFLARQIQIEMISSDLELEKKQDQLENLKKEHEKILGEPEIKGQESDVAFSTGKPAKLKKEPSQESLKGKIEVILVALGTIIGFSVMLATLTDVWPCDVFEILNVEFPFFC